MPQPRGISETDLYPPVKEYLEALGYQVMGEAAGCDVAAVRDGELIAVELKKALSLKLLRQAAERQESADGVYIALPAEGSALPQNIRASLKLIKRLELGLLLVRFMNHRTRVDLVLHPEERERRRNTRRRAAILREMNGRSGDHTPGGTRGQVVTAYREEALFLASLLKVHGELSPAECRRLSGPERSAAILRNNYYGWFERVRRGLYRLHPAGRAALTEHAEIVSMIKEKKK